MCGSKPIPIGSLVRVRGLPAELEQLPRETQAAFRAALGKQFRVVGHGVYGHVELELGPELDAALGGFMNSIWIEPNLVEEIS